MMATGIPGILKRSGDQVIHDLILSGQDVDLDLNQITIERINTLSYTDREVSFAIKARTVGADGSPPIYGGATSVIYNRFIADNYFSRFEWHISLDAPYTVKRVREALNAQTEVHWDAEDFKEVDDYALAVNSNGRTTLSSSPYSRRLYLELDNSKLTVVITPTARTNIARMLPPSVIQPPEDYFRFADPRTNLALRLPDANGVIVATELKALVADQVFDEDLGDAPVVWMSRVYGLSDGVDVAWVQQTEPANYNLFGAKVLYNGVLTDDYPKPYNTRLDRVLIVELSEEHCLNYYGKGIIFYNLSRDTGNS